MLDSSDALFSLLKTVERNRTKDGKAKDWVSAIIIFFVIFIGLVVFAYVSNRKARETARLRHEKNKRKIEIDNKKAMAACSKNDETSITLDFEIGRLQNEVESINERIKKIQQARNADQVAISAITSWRDI